MEKGQKTQRIFEVVNPNHLSIWVRDYLLDVQAANRSEFTIRFYRQKLEPFVAFLEERGVTEPEEIDARDIRAFLVHLQQSHSDGGVHAYWRGIRAFIRFLVREEALDKNPLNRIRSPRVDQTILEPVPTEHVQAMLACCSSRKKIDLRDKAILMTLLDTGLRAGEMLRLVVGDVNLTDGSVQVHKTKSRKGRVVFVGRRTRLAIAAFLRTRNSYTDADPLWIAYRRAGRHSGLSYDGLRSVVVRRSEQAGIPTPSLHSFRRSFALSMLRNGADLISLSRLMGHGSLPVLQRYLRQVTDDLGEVHAIHSPADTLL